LSILSLAVAALAHLMVEHLMGMVVVAQAL
jgi:hypothetical protein